MQRRTKNIVRKRLKEKKRGSASHLLGYVPVRSFSAQFQKHHFSSQRVKTHDADHYCRLTNTRAELEWKRGKAIYDSNDVIAQRVGSSRGTNTVNKLRVMRRHTNTQRKSQQCSQRGEKRF